MVRQTSIARILSISYSDSKLVFNIGAYPFKLYYDFCPIEFYDIINTTTEYDLWKFTYSAKKYKIYKLKPIYDAYLKY